MNLNRLCASRVKMKNGNEDGQTIKCTHVWITPKGKYTRCKKCGNLPGIEDEKSRK